MTTLRKRKQNKTQIKRLEQGFVNSWDPKPHDLQYNALEDKHNKVYFKLPVIQNHLKKLKHNLKQQPKCKDNVELINSIKKNKSQNKKERIEMISNNLKIYIDDYLRHFKGKGTGRTSIGSVDELKSDPRYKQKKHQRSKTRAVQSKQVQPSKTVQSSLSPKAVNHDTFMDYIKKKKELLTKEEDNSILIQQK